MAKLTASIGATQKTVANQQFNPLAFTFLNSIPLINGLKERQRFSRRTLVYNPLLTLLLPCAKKRRTPIIGFESLNKCLAIFFNDIAGPPDFRLAGKFLPTRIQPFSNSAGR